MTTCNDGYDGLRRVLANAVQQASGGKGRERHVHKDEPFEEQPICRGGRRFGPGCLLYQAWKKTDEVPKLMTMDNGKERALQEIYGAINYLAGNTKIAVFKPGVGLYALSTTDWTWSQLIVGSPVTAYGDGIWKRIEYMPELQCFGLFGKQGEAFYALPLPDQLK